ncbi:non-ribosomal peptide synthetase [Amycolatopsis suaedae]|uniref:Phenyloxazoline synthase MbtB n=1 Tax=Amycolatopsis suaedae TaxID=2510978 RepID=A0A4Q7J0Y4_9PSEU|nr:non-ribosomal peptide synthetase [Amycolatopsis suaedae]RZQ61021.1 amino acid adenylation domain-containing protein [Amycolatopsis suaedae]
MTPDPDALTEPFPLNDTQQVQWLGRHGAFEGGNFDGDAIVHVYWEIDARDIDLVRLEESWQQVMRRHGMLRAVLLPDGRQQVLPEVGHYHIEVLDLRELSPDQLVCRLGEVRAELTSHTRGADVWPLFDIKAALMPDGGTRVCLGFDLLMVDIGSVRLISRDWRRLYAGEELPPLELSYRDYVLAVARAKDTPEYAKARDYWRERVRHLPARPELPLAVTTAEEGRESVSFEHWLDDAGWHRITERADALGLPPATVLLAAYAVALGRWSRTAEFTINATVVNRLPMHPAIDDLVGEFISFDLLSVDLAGAKDIIDVARSLREQGDAAAEHRMFSGAEVLRELAEVQGGIGRVAFPVVFTSTILRGTEPGDVTWFGWLGDIVDVLAQTPQVWLDFALLETPVGAHLAWHGARKRFPDGVLDAMFDAFRALVDDLAAEEDRWSAPLTAGVATAPEEDEAPEGLLCDGVMACARRTPERVAVVSGDGEELTFGALGSWATGVAGELRALGVRPGELVAVAVPKSGAQIAAVLGVHLAGAGYLPVDLDLPARRRAELIEAGGCDVVLVRCADDTVTWPDGVRTVVVDDRRDHVGELAESPAAPSDVAYVIFTSGSTGVPKGVAVSHRAALNTCVDVCARFAVTADDVVLGLSSLSFDLSVFDIFGILGAGGRLVLPRPDARREPRHWLELARDHGVTLWNSVPALAELALSQAVASGETTALSGVRLALWSGDWIPVDLPDRWREVARSCQVVSLGGATEAAVWSVCYEVGRVDESWDSIPYGRALGNQRCHVLNDRLADCPVWTVGELYIGGAGLADGYWRDPDRTGERFVVHPVSGERLYRTGDLGRWLPDGNIEFLGREDLQVKVGGYRIELGEIEAALIRHERVASAVVVAAGERQHRRLAAFLLPEAPVTDEDALVAECTESLRASLPGYMVPGVITVVDRMPLTSNGKVDRGRLAALVGGVDGDVAAIPGRGDVVAVLARIFRDVLGVEAVGPGDSLFALGGDSIAGIQIVIRAIAEGLDVTPSDLFANYTLDELAMTVTVRGAGAARATAEWPLSQYQTTVLERAGGPEHVGVHRIVLPVSDPEAAARAAGRLLDEEPAPRLRLAAEPDGWGQRIVTPATEDAAGVPVVDLTTLPRARRAVALAEMVDELAGELDLVHGPAGRASVFTLGEDDHRVAVVLSVLVADAASLPVLVGALGGNDQVVHHANAAGTVLRLDADRTDLLLRTCARPEWPAPDELAVAAVALALGRVEAPGPVVLDVERDRRRQGTVDVDGQVGPFAAIVPVSVDVGPGMSVTRIGEACRAATRPARGDRTARVLVRHAGDLGAALGDDTVRGLAGDLPYPVAVTSLITGGQLVLVVHQDAPDDELVSALDQAVHELCELAVR